MWPLILFLLIFVSGCEHDELNSSNSQPIQRLSQESLPGKAEYEGTCAACHDGSLKKAPHRDMIALMTPESIFSAMTKGVMQTQASNLSDKERRQIAEYLSGGSLGQIVKKIECDLRHRRKKSWLISVPCHQSFSLAVQGSRPHASHSCCAAHVPLILGGGGPRESSQSAVFQQT